MDIMIETQGIKTMLTEHLKEVLYKLETYDLSEMEQDELVNSLSEKEYKSYLVIMSDETLCKNIVKSS